MRYKEWTVLFIVVGLGIALANFVGFRVAFLESLPGIGILILISLAAVGMYEGYTVKTAYRCLLFDHRTLGGMPNITSEHLCY